MKRFLLSVFFACTGAFLYAQTATNFNCNDCQGNNHDFFSELNSGKVIVLCWVMPCNNCIVPAQNANSIVNSYSVSNPGKVLFYLCDDFGTTSCLTLNNWANTNTLTNVTIFSNSVISMADYGASGMPKIVVVGGGTNHIVYDNQINTLNTTTFSTAINNAIAASPTGIRELTENSFAPSVAPNPASSELRVSFSSTIAEKITLQIYALNGQKVSEQVFEAVRGENSVTMSVQNLAAGNYLVRMKGSEKSGTARITINR